MYIESWRKFQAGLPLEPLEAQVAEVIAEHPEYHALLEAGEATLDAQFPPESGVSNPFLHMGLHLALREQVVTDRPSGIARIHARLAQREGSRLAAEHQMLEVLAQMLWEAQRAGRPPDESVYLERLARL